MKTSLHPLRRRSASARAAGALLVLILEALTTLSPVNAGDILRGGATTGAPTGASNPVGTAPPPVVASAGGSTRDSLARTAQAVQAMQAMQQAARNLANQNNGNHAIKNPSGKGGVLPDVPDGLGKGGLQIDPTVTKSGDPAWTGAELPTQTPGTTPGKTQVTIKQNAQQAILNWETFNVGKNTTLTFDQSLGGANASQWIAFNKVNDPLANPTQILGSIQAQGQVYVINRNGIVFGGGSQVNVHALVASTLSINDNLVKNGLLNNPTNEFLFTGLGGDASTPVGNVIVEAGAQLTAPSSAAKVGGRIALIGANVTNEGTISTTDGQTILAAGLQVGMAAHASSDPSLRGLDVFVGAVVDPASTLAAYAGTATNNGYIDAGRANVTIVGKNVQQMGVINSSTSVSFNGRIDLLANYDAIGNPFYDSTSATSQAFFNRSVGTVTLGQGSVTQIVPELASTDKVIGSTLALSSQVNLQGSEIHFDNDSILYASSGTVNALTGVWNVRVPTSSTDLGVYQFIASSGRIDLDAGAVIDVSGSKNVASSVTSNIVKVELRGSELADSPLLRNGALRGQTIYVDITETGTYNGKTWIGTPLADVSGYANLVQRTVGELTASGGKVNLSAGDAVVIRDGAKVDVSGGTIDYAGGVVQTSRVYSGTQIYDITDATPDRVYDGVYRGGAITTSKAWNVTQQFVNPLTLNGSRYQEGYTQGGNGGTLSISGAAVAVDGTLKGTTYTGVRQRTIGPVASSLNISVARQVLSGNLIISESPNPTAIVFSNTNPSTKLDDFSLDSTGKAVALPDERLDQLTLSPDLLGENGFGKLSVSSPNGDITVEKGVTLETTPRGSISLAGANIDIEGNIISHGGALSFTAYDISPDAVALAKINHSDLPAADPTRGNFTLGADATLSTAGYLVDDRPTSATLLQTPLATAGGSISITALSANLGVGSLVDVSGGVLASGGGKYTYGNAGSLSILAGQDAELTGVTGGGITLGGELRGMSGAKGGSLSLRAAAVQVGGTNSTAGVLVLDSDFFNQGGFSSFSLTGIGTAETPAMVIKSDAHVAPVVSSWLASEKDGAIVLDSYVKDAGLRSTVSLSFNATGSRDEYQSVPPLLARGDVLEEQGAVIDAGPLGAVTLSGQTVTVQGKVLAAGGSITVAGGSSLALPGTSIGTAAQSTVWIGSSAVLDASGTVLLVPDNFGRRRGAVLDGGSIKVSGNVLADSGSVMNVSGASGTLDLLQGETGQSLADLVTGVSGTTSRPLNIRGKATRIDSDGGTITLAGGQMLNVDSTLHGDAGGSTATGGTLSVSSGIFLLSGSLRPDTVTMQVVQSGDVIPDGIASGIGVALPADSSGIPGGGRFAADRFLEGGFDNLDLAGALKFSGPVTIKADGRITAGTRPVIYADGSVSLSGSYVSLGNTSLTPFLNSEIKETYIDPNTNLPIRMAPVNGTGSITVSGSLIDIGDLSLQGIGKANFIAANGDIRGNGTLAVAGDISMTAGQIYPPTDLKFTISAFDYTSGGVAHTGSVTITGSGKRSLPLSAGGTLAIYGSTIVQNGTLRAPFGTIILGWDGSGAAPADILTGGGFAKTSDITLGSKGVTSVSAIDPITGKGVTIPYGVSLDGTTWLDPGGNDITNGGLPQKSVTVAGQSIVTETGSQVDVRGGGDLFAYRFVAGNGGSTDILASSGSFAIIPGYSAGYAPYAPFDNRSTATLGGDAGYVNSSIQVGQQIRLDAGSGLPAGVYTLLPARYALLPGAYLITPQAGTAIGNVVNADGSKVISGLVFNGLDSGTSLPGTSTRFEIASSRVVNSRAEYTQLLANTFLTATGGFRLPGDSGQLVLSATRAMVLQGDVLSAASGSFRGGLIDISSPGDIFIGNGTSATVPTGTLVLDANLISGFGAESILIGGVRSASTDGTLVSVTAGTVTLDNAGAALVGPEIILAAKQEVDLKDGAQIKQGGKATRNADTLIVGNNLATGATATGSGNGALIRVNHGASGSLVRRDVTPGGTVGLVVGAGATLAGDHVLLDSTGSSQLGVGASISAGSLSLSSGRISLALDASVTPGADAGLVLSSAIIAQLSSASSLSLASYSSIDLLGSGTVGGGAGKPVIDSLELHAASIRGIGADHVVFNAGQILIGGQAGAVAPTAPALNSGVVSFRSDSLQLGSGALQFAGFSEVDLTATKEIRAVGNGSLASSGSLGLSGPLLTANNAITYAFGSTGDLSFTGTPATGAVATAGLGSSISLTGSSVELDSRIVLPGGRITANATSGDVTVTGTLDASGATRRFKDQTRTTKGGTIQLTSATGDVTLAAGSLLDVSSTGDDAGTVSLSAQKGSVAFDGSLSGKGGSNKDSGSFTLVTSVPAPVPSTDPAVPTPARELKLAAIDAMLDAAFFNQSRDYRVTTGDVVVDGTPHAHSYTVSTDSGSIKVTGTIDASGATGGTVRLVADKSLTLADGAKIDASGADFSTAGAGGAVTLETRGDAGGVINLAAGSTIDLSIDTATSASADAGHFTGTLNLRAPQIAGGTDLAVTSLGSTVVDASSIIVEGYKTYDLTGTTGVITSAVKTQVMTDGTAFVANAAAIESRILGGSSSPLGSVLTVRPGAEIINTTGDITLGATNSSGTNGDWNLATYRFGGEQVPGLLTLRAAGNLVFYNSLSDGFTTGAFNSALLANNAGLSDNAESWSFRLIAGADFSAADTRQVITRAPSATLGTTTGSLKLGKNAGRLVVTGNAAALTSTVLNPNSNNGFFQVIRTGSGDIDVVAGGDVQLLNPFASIYTAGTQVKDATMGGIFQVPNTTMFGGPSSLGAVQQSSTPVQYTSGGGDVSITAADDIIHLTQVQDPTSTVTKLIYIQDSQREMPVNWLYRRSYVDPATGQFGSALDTFGSTAETASTTWWVDFTNFFEGAGALGGGNVTLKAGRDVSNVDAVTPTNARMPAGKPDASKLVELGGGDVNVTAGRNIDAGVYYVERGEGSLTAGGSIITNSTRAATTGNPGTANTSNTLGWLPTTLFVGDASFDVTAGDNALLGPVANPFLLPQGFGNNYIYKTWFSTYSPDAGVDAIAYGGDLNVRQSSSTVNNSPGSSILQTWFDLELHLVATGSSQTASNFQPWLRLTETSVTPFSYAFKLMPGTLKLASMSGDVNLTGSMTLSPSSTGTLEVLAAGSINGFHSEGVDSSGLTVWSSATVNLSDANPASIPGITNSFSYQQVATSFAQLATTQVNFLNTVAALFAETGSLNGSLNQRQAPHSDSLHAGDDQPVRIYSDSGDISGFTLYSSKFAEVLAGQDLRDISLYIQNESASNISVVAAGRDIIAYDSSTAGRVAAASSGNRTLSSAAGDLQISGPGTLEVLAGRNLDLGIGVNNADGTGNGITSIGNSRNPYLGFDGAQILAAAGLGDATSLDASKADFASFITKYVDSDTGAAHLKELGYTPDQFAHLATQEQKDQVALQVFFLVLRDTGRNYNNPDSSGFRSYQDGRDAVATLFPGTAWGGDIFTRSRDIRTRSGGDITLLAPGGSIRLAQSVVGSPLVPPGIITESGGNISIFTDQDVNLGISRIFTLRGGNEVIWSSNGNIAAGSSSKTIQSAPPTRVLIDPQSADVKTDLAGLATGGGIGVLSTVAGVKPSDVDLIAPNGTVDAGDAGIRVTGNINIAAAVVVNSSNISAGGTSSGTSSSVSAVSASVATAASNASVAATVTESTPGQNNAAPVTAPDVVEAPSDISVEVIGYGGDGGGSDDSGSTDEEEKKKKKQAEEQSSGEGH